MTVVSIFPDGDSYVLSLAALHHQNTSGFNGLGVGYVTYGAYNPYCRSLLMFNLATHGVAIGATINSAIYKWYCQLAAPNADPCTLHRCSRIDWEAISDGMGSDYADWIHYLHSGASSWINPGVDYTTPSQAFVLAIATGTQSIACQSLVQDAVDNRNRLVSMLLRKDVEDDVDGAVYFSQQIGFPFLKPVLVVDYTNPVITGPHLRPNKFLGC